MINPSNVSGDHISIILNDADKVTKIIQSGIKAALMRHKLAGNPVCELQDNKVVWIQPENIPVEIKA
ncbi:MAG: hypothetical protein KBD83_06370 [Gammaproteobacteria bacterium]|nr:hypothetical protein [Gammaproteobacteria bacterium]